MGMGIYAVGSFVIGYDDLKKICPKEIEAIEKAKYFDWVGWAVMGQWLGWADNDQIIDVLHDAVLNNSIVDSRAANKALGTVVFSDLFFSRVIASATFSSDTTPSVSMILENF